MAKKRQRLIISKNGDMKLTPYGWLWEFTKKVVVAEELLYIVGMLYVMSATYLAVTQVADTTALGTLITEINETFRVVIGGYIVKAGVENIAKIITTNMLKKSGKDDEAITIESEDIKIL